MRAGGVLESGVQADSLLVELLRGTVRQLSAGKGLAAHRLAAMTDDTNGDETTEQEAIALLDRKPVPDTPGFTFLGPPAKSGDTFEIQIIQDSTGASIGSARGSTVKDVIEHAREIAGEFSED